MLCSDLNYLEISKQIRRSSMQISNCSLYTYKNSNKFSDRSDVCFKNNEPKINDDEEVEQFISNYDISKDTTISGKKILTAAAMGSLIGMSSYFSKVSNTNNLALLGKKTLIGAIILTAATIAAKLVKKISSNDNNVENKVFWDFQSKGIVSGGFFSAIGATFLTLTAGKSELAEKLKGERLPLKGGITGFILGLLLGSVVIAKKTYDKIKASGKPLNIAL